jgi:hypothetical protein
MPPRSYRGIAGACPQTQRKREALRPRRSVVIALCGGGGGRVEDLWHPPWALGTPALSPNGRSLAPSCGFAREVWKAPARRAESQTTSGSMWRFFPAPRGRFLWCLARILAWAEGAPSKLSLAPRCLAGVGVGGGAEGGDLPRREPAGRPAAMKVPAILCRRRFAEPASDEPDRQDQLLQSQHHVQPKVRVRDHRDDSAEHQKARQHR